jgi:hypothetical protein
LYFEAGKQKAGYIADSRAMRLTDLRLCRRTEVQAIYVCLFSARHGKPGATGLSDVLSNYAGCNNYFESLRVNKFVGKLTGPLIKIALKEACSAQGRKSTSILVCCE